MSRSVGVQPSFCSRKNLEDGTVPDGVEVQRRITPVPLNIFRRFGGKTRAKSLYGILPGPHDQTISVM